MSNQQNQPNQKIPTKKRCSRCKSIKPLEKFLRFGLTNENESQYIDSNKLYWKQCYDCRLVGRKNCSIHRERLKKSIQTLNDTVDNLIFSSTASLISNEDNNDDRTEHTIEYPEVDEFDQLSEEFGESSESTEEYDPWAVAITRKAGKVHKVTKTKTSVAIIPRQSYN